MRQHDTLDSFIFQLQFSFAYFDFKRPFLLIEREELQIL